MKDYRTLLRELPSNTIVCALGEFNPPTLGHEMLVKTVKELAEQKRSDHVIYTIPSELIQEEKKETFLNLMFPKTKFKSLGESFFATAVKQLNEKYKNVIIIAGADQLDEFKKISESTNVQIITIGDKDPDADNSKMKQMATKGLYEEFKKKLPTTIRDLDGKRLMNEMRNGLGLEPVKDQIVLVKDKLREKYFRGEIFNEGDIVESNGEKFEIVKRGSNHLLLKEESGKLVSKWIQDVKPTEEKVMKEAVIQPNGTDKIQSNAPESDTGAKQDEKEKANGKTKGFLTFYNYNMKEANEPVDPAAKERVKAQLTLKQAKEKENLAAKQERERQMLHKEDIDLAQDAPSIQAIADKHGVSVAQIQSQLVIGMKVEAEHGKNKGSEKEIALDHLNERPDYYVRLKKFVEHVQENYDDNRTGFAKKPREDDEGYSKPKFKAKSVMDRPHTVHVDGKKWKTFSNGHQAHAAAKTLEAKGKKATAIAHFKEETEEQCADHKVQLKRFKAQIRPEQVQESVLNPNDPHTDYKEKSKVLHQLSLNKDVDQAHVTQRKLDLDKEYSKVKKEEVVVENTEYDKAEENKRSADSAKEQGDMFAHHLHMADHHDNLSQWHASKGRHGEADRHAEKAEQHHEKAMGFKEEVELDEAKKKKAVSGSDTPAQLPAQGNTFDPFFKEDSDEDIVESVTDEDIMDLYEEDEIVLEYEDDGEEIPALEEEKQYDLMEVLSRTERMKGKIRLRKTSAKRGRSTKIALKRYSNPQTINKRARRLAIKLMKKRMLRGRDYSKVSVGEKERMEKTLAGRKDQINRVAAKLVSRIRKVEKARMSKGKVSKGTMPAVF